MGSDLFFVYYKLQELSGITNRVAELFEVVDEITESELKARECVSLEDGSQLIVFDNVDIENPDKQRLLTGLHMKIPVGNNLCIMGNNGVGKTSLFRTLGGLWASGGGKIIRPPNDPSQFLFCPQKSYLVSGTLRDQITYPLHFKDNTYDEKLKKLVIKVGLGKFLDGKGLDVYREDWYRTLSGGEAQKVGFARLFFHRPTFALLDEVTSGVHREAEEELYSQLRDDDIGYLSIIHKDSLQKFHDRKLVVTGVDGKWELGPTGY